MIPRLGIVADDVTGASDIGGLLAKAGLAVRLFTAEADLATLPERLRDARTDVVIVDTDSRLEPPDIAAAKVRHATRALLDAGRDRFWKKTCSVFRGNVGVEFDAMLDELGAGFGVAVAAFPRNGRRTVGGRHSVHGIPLDLSEFARDPAHPTREADLARVLSRQSVRPVALVPLEDVRGGPEAARASLERARGAGGYALCDAETQEDLAILARALRDERVLLGSSGLAEELPAVWGPAEPFDPLEGLPREAGGPTLVLAGSTMPQSRAQVDALAQAGATVLTLDGPAALGDPDGTAADLAERATASMTAGAHTVVRSENWPEAVEATRAAGRELDLDPIATSRRISMALARAARETLAASGARRLIVLGGDTSAAACRALGMTEALVLDEIAPGLPALRTVDPPDLLLVLKSGSFGGPSFVLDAIAHLDRPEV